VGFLGTTNPAVTKKPEVGTEAHMLGKLLNFGGRDPSLMNVCSLQKDALTAIYDGCLSNHCHKN
jgi:hypothetical protein